MDFAIDTNRLFVIKAKIVPVSTIILFGVRHQRRYFHSNVSDIKGKPKVVKDKRVYKSICNGRYSILKILGEGAMGRVYLAVDEVSGKEVALKMVPKAVSDRRERLDELRDNYNRVESLHHPNIAAVKHLVKIPELGEYALMMEYVPGPTLLQFRKAQLGGASR